VKFVSAFVAERKRFKKYFAASKVKIVKQDMEPLLDKLLRHTPPIKPRFFLIVAWYALISPFAAASIIGFFLCVGIPDHRIDPSADDAFGVAACILISSVLASIVSLFGIPKHRAKVIAWKSVVGFLLSLILFYGLAIIGMGEMGQQ
jgi:hypothetical protein